MSFTCQEHAKKLSATANAIVCHHYILSVSPYVSINNLHKEVMNTLNENSFVEEIMGVGSTSNPSSWSQSLSCLFSATSLNHFINNRVDTIQQGLFDLGKDIVVYVDPGRFIFSININTQAVY